MIRILFIIWFLIIASFSGNAQLIKNLTISGSLESNSNYYFTDNKLSFFQPESALATNNYLQLQFQYKFLEAGFQYENYLPPLLGYSVKLEGHRLANRYLKFYFDKKQITFGHFFEQYGNGLVLRTYEDRALGINTALDGMKYKWEPNRFVTIKAFGAKQLGYKKNGESILAGGNLVFRLSELLMPEEEFLINTELSYVLKNQKESEENVWIDKGPLNVSSYSGVLNLAFRRFNLQTEIVSKSFDPTQINGIEKERGMAFLVNPSYAKKGLGINLILRSLQHMDFRSESKTTNQFFMLNYIPANTKQHKYSLANLHPYSARAKNEFGWQADVFYLFQKKTKLGGKYGTKIALNYSKQFVSGLAQMLSFSELVKPENMVYRDFNVELIKRWNQKWKTNFSFISLDMENYFLIADYEAQKSNIFVAEILYKLKTRKALRFEIQHLFAETSSKNWYAWHAEYSVAPRWSVFISDMTNYSGNEIHYPNGGFQLNIKSTRLQFNYGRNREGFKCSGGICKWMPAYTGFGFALTTNF